MASPDQLALLIRFAIGDLSGRNGHHEFEELCRHLARARIASNVVPATGPVGSGGDQGRDFETFRSYLATELGPHGAFLALSSNDTIVFACTLQRDGLAGKIKADVAKILAEGTPVDHIVAFVAGELPVGPRHDLQDEVYDEHSVGLDVLDVRSIAEELAQPDTFWIARRFLALPEDLSPPAPADPVPEWYATLRETWRAREPTSTLADLLEIKRGLRRATFNEAERADLPFWLASMRKFLEPDVHEDLQQRARYEVAVATLRGIGDLRPADALAAEHLNQACTADEPIELRDASVLLMYAGGAFLRGLTAICADDLASWNERLRAQVERVLEASTGATRRADLLRTLGQLCLHIDLRRPDLSQWNSDEIATGGDEAEDDEYFAPLERLVDAEAGMRHWVELTTLLDEAGLFAVESFSEQLGVLTPVLVDHPCYRQLTDAVDAQVEKTAGRAAAAARCRDRAVLLHRAGRHVDALHEFHQAKVGWFSGDSLRGSLLAMMLIASCYEELGFLHAAKYHVLLAARVAENSGDPELLDLFAQGVCLAAHMDYGLGSWFTSAATLETGLALHSNFVSALDPDDHRVLPMMYSLLWVAVAGRDLAPALGVKVTQLMVEAGLWEAVEELVANTTPRTESEWLDLVDPQLSGEWMGDLKKQTKVTFAGLGTAWTLVGDNEPTVNRAVQRLAAAAQVLLTELAGEDLALLCTDIHLRVDVGDAATERVIPEPSNEGRKWLVTLTPWAEHIRGEEHRLRIELLGVLSAILAEASLLPMSEFMQRVEAAFERGLSHKIGFGPTLDELLIWTRNEEYEALAAEVQLPTAIEQAPHNPSENPELAWRDGPGPTYDEREAAEAIQRRYERVPNLFSFTLTQLKNDNAFRHTLAELRSRGWLDWMILNCVASHATNYRLRRLGYAEHLGEPGPRGEEARRAFQMLGMDGETEQMEVVPTAEFSVENLEFNRVVGLQVFIQGVGLDVHQPTPDIPAVEHFLAERYRYWLDDVPHSDPFA